MYCVFSQKPVTELFSVKNQFSYIEDKIDFFIMKWGITKANLYDEVSGYADYYVVFHDKPLYLAIISDSFWYSKIKNTEMSGFTRIVRWGNIPEHYPPTEEEIEKCLPRLPKEKRLWIGFEYIRNVCEIIAKNNFKQNPYFEICLNGKLDNSRG